MNTDELNRAMVIICDSLQRTAKAAARAARALATATAEAISCAAAQEKEMELYRELQAGAETRDPFAELLQAMEQSLQAELADLAELAEDAPPLPQTITLRPPKYLGPVNKANHTASRPPRRARSSCYKRHR
jgi:hypothetical protein